MSACRWVAKVPAVPALVDTTIRLLGQDPLAQRIPTSEVLRVAEILDASGFQALEVSGGGVFDSAVQRGVESPWERIRALNARVRTPLGMALREHPFGVVLRPQTFGYLLRVLVWTFHVPDRPRRKHRSSIPCPGYSFRGHSPLDGDLRFFIAAAIML